MTTLDFQDWVMSISGITTFSFCGVLFALVIISGYLFLQYRKLLSLILILQVQTPGARADVTRSLITLCDNLRQQLLTAGLHDSSDIDYAILQSQVLQCESKLTTSSSLSRPTNNSQGIPGSILHWNNIASKLQDFGLEHVVLIFIIVVGILMCAHGMVQLFLKIQRKFASVKTIYCLVFRSKSDSCVVDLLTVYTYASALQVFAYEGNISNISITGKFFQSLNFSWQGFGVRDKMNHTTFSFQCPVKLSFFTAKRLKCIVTNEFDCHLAIRSDNILLPVNIQQNESFNSNIADTFV